MKATNEQLRKEYRAYVENTVSEKKSYLIYSEWIELKFLSLERETWLEQKLISEPQKGSDELKESNLLLQITIDYLSVVIKKEGINFSDMWINGVENIIKKSKLQIEKCKSLPLVSEPKQSDIVEGKIAFLKNEFIPESLHFDTGTWVLKKGTPILVKQIDSDNMCLIEYIEATFYIHINELSCQPDYITDMLDFIDNSIKKKSEDEIITNQP